MKKGHEIGKYRLPGTACAAICHETIHLPHYAICLCANKYIFFIAL